MSSYWKQYQRGIQQHIAWVMSQSELESVEAILPEAQPDKGEECVECGKDSWTCEHYKQYEERERQ